MKKILILLAVLLLLLLAVNTLAQPDTSKVLLVCPEKMNRIECSSYIRRSTSE